MRRNRSSSWLTITVIAALVVALGFAFWPRPVMVDMGQVRVASMRVTIDEEGRTRVHDTFIVSTPVAGRLLRVEVEPGDAVDRGETVIAQMLPRNPAALDVRTREQARAAVTAAEAGLRLSQAELNRAIADQELAQADLSRAARLKQNQSVSEAAYDRAVRESRAAQASTDTADAAIGMRQAELSNARAQLVGFDDRGLASAIGVGSPSTGISVRAPATGRVLRVLQQSETTLPAGAPIMEIGDIDSDLEVLVELMSTDAVQVAAGDPVLIERWGGEGVLRAVVERVDPLGFTKFSALGVEEQRVNAVIRFVDAQSKAPGLGHGFRVEARIVVWAEEAALVVPSNALFRTAFNNGDDWAVFVVDDGILASRSVEIGHNNGIDAEVLGGLTDGDTVVLYPSSGLSSGTRVAQRIVQ
jgi:HlyD family secretion protein